MYKKGSLIRLVAEAVSPPRVQRARLRRVGIIATTGDGGEQLRTDVPKKSRNYEPRRAGSRVNLKKSGKEVRAQVKRILAKGKKLTKRGGGTEESADLAHREGRAKGDHKRASGQYGRSPETRGERLASSPNAVRDFKGTLPWDQQRRTEK